MIAYRQQKIENAICYLAAEHKKRAKMPAYQTYIYKYLAMFDFEVLTATGRPALGLRYVALPKGPVPKLLYDNRQRLEGKCFRAIKDDEGHYAFVPKKKANLDFFSQFEIEVLNRILDRFAHPGIRTDEVNDASHEIVAYKKAWARRGESRRVAMSLDDTFGDLHRKNLSDLTPEEERYLVFKTLEGVETPA